MAAAAEVMDAAVVLDDPQVGNAWLIFQWNISFSSLKSVIGRGRPNYGSAASLTFKKFYIFGGLSSSRGPMKNSS